MPLFLALLFALLTSPLSAQGTPRDTALWSAIIAAEDTRADDTRSLDPLVRGVNWPDPMIQRLAVRALGRMERASLVPGIAPMLASADAAVRIEAANALAQAVTRGEPQFASSALFLRLPDESDPAVRGAIAQALGRIPWRPGDDLKRAEATLTQVAGESEPVSRYGAARGLESLLRRSAATHAPAPATIARLREMVLGPPVTDSLSDRIRRLALLSLITVNQADSGVIAAAAMDPDPQLRRIAVGSNYAADSLPWLVLARITGDPAEAVRFDALRAYGRRRLRDGCGPVIAAVGDSGRHVPLLAIDLLGNPCGEARGPVLTVLMTEARRLPAAAAETGWHRAAHAVVALARIAPDSATGLLGLFARHASPWVRAYAARAAATVRDRRVLERLARDTDDNVREAAVAGLVPLARHDADSIYRSQLTRRDYQLLRTAAAALDSTPDGEAALPALLSALARVTAERRETARDARVALLERIGQLGGSRNVEALRPYLSDFDTLIARRTSEILNRWSGYLYRPAARPLPPRPAPAPGELVAMEALRPVIRLRSGGEIELRLRPHDAPTNTERFVRLARGGYFNGLTFHRIAPNFVVQGGSPGANEYWGDGPYTRDEVSAAPHLRGTVGVSTRGHDTGDGQIFINLIDNWRLDHAYTIFAEVVNGMDVVDQMPEGAVIERVEFR